MRKVLFAVACMVTFTGLLCAWEGHEESPHYEWISGEDVAVHEDGIYMATAKGMMRLNVVGYDRVTDQYQVLCSCLLKPGYFPYETLAAP